ncbi:conserved Plasmodium protein, unknown function [Plasmodium vinckei lentum]|uniref:CS domain-containing protein n=1 Tax=Plasmodium vinckei lentum TaxID=138297 RepID=A0A6V7SPX9_PLAVN|nr:conserved Plasmodium protein, unknown function [Plasmodium vinckei lentum]
MLKLIKNINTFLSILFFVHFLTVNCINNSYYHSRICKIKLINNSNPISDKILKYSHFIRVPIKSIAINKKSNKTSILSNTEQNDSDFDIELENLMKDIEDGKLGDESLKLYREVEKNAAIKEEETKQIEEQMSQLDQMKSINEHNVEDVINNTDNDLKTCVRKAFYNTGINENDNPNVKKEYANINKIEKTFEEIDDLNSPNENLNINDIYKKINSMKDDDYKSVPFKDTAKEIMKYKGMLHMPYEVGTLLNNAKFDWRESLDHIELNIPIFDETNQEDILFQFKNDHIKLEIMQNGEKVILLDHKLCGKICCDDAYWVITTDYKINEKHIHLVLSKVDRFKYIWEKLFQDL